MIGEGSAVGEKKEDFYLWVENIIVKGNPRLRSLQKGKTLFSFFCMKSPFKNEQNVYFYS